MDFLLLSENEFLEIKCNGTTSFMDFEHSACKAAGVGRSKAINAIALRNEQFLPKTFCGIQLEQARDLFTETVRKPTCQRVSPRNRQCPSSHGRAVAYP